MVELRRRHVAFMLGSQGATNLPALIHSALVLHKRPGVAAPGSAGFGDIGDWDVEVAAPDTQATDPALSRQDHPRLRPGARDLGREPLYRLARLREGVLRRH